MYLGSVIKTNIAENQCEPQKLSQILLTIICYLDNQIVIAMNEEELLYALALQKAKNVGDTLAKKLIQHCGSPKSVWNSKIASLAKIYGIGNARLNNFQDSNLLKKAENELRYLRDNKIEIWYFTDENYPERLKHCIDGPLLLFKRGKSNLNNQKMISVVGTRNMTSYGREFVEQLMSDLKPFNPIIVSGFAYGVDICAHREALKNGMETIAVLAHGYEEMYPKIHSKYIPEVIENGAFLTDAWHDDELIRESFLKRNRIVAGISEATIVIESAESGGSLVTADIANSYNRDVLAVPGRSIDPFSKGCNDLIKMNKASLFSETKDLIEMLNWEELNSVPVVQKQLFVELENEEQLIYDYLLKQGKQLLDIIALECKFPIHKTSTLLFNMEMKGVVRPYPGKLYEAT